MLLFLNCVKKIVLCSVEFLVKNYITHDSAEKSLPIIESR